MKKRFLLPGLLFLLCSYTLHADITHRHGAICVLDNDSDDMNEEELLALEQMPEIKPSEFQQWIIGKAGMILGWYMSYQRYVRKVASWVPKRKRSKRRV